jgi:hypothetical protein
MESCDMSHNVSNNGAGAKVAPVYVLVNGEIAFDAPIGRVWRHLIDYSSWQNYTTREHVCGEPGREGEVVLLKKEEATYSSPPYYARTVKIEPERRIMWKTYRGEASGDKGYFGFIDFTLSPDGERTLFRSNNIYEYLVPYEDEGELDEFRKKRYAISASVSSVTRAKLKKLIEEDKA